MGVESASGFEFQSVALTANTLPDGATTYVAGPKSVIATPAYRHNLSLTCSLLHNLAIADYTSRSVTISDRLFTKVSKKYVALSMNNDSIRPTFNDQKRITKQNI